MKITVRLFASFREATGASQTAVDITSDTTISQLWSRLIEQYPRLAPMSRSAAFAVNGEYARRDVTLHDGDEVAFLPPVSGGCARSCRLEIESGRPYSLRGDNRTDFGRPPRCSRAHGLRCPGAHFR